MVGGSTVATLIGKSMRNQDGQAVLGSSSPYVVTQLVKDLYLDKVIRKVFLLVKEMK